MASIVAFPARDSRTRFECLRHAVDARRVQLTEVEIDRRRAELTMLGHQVADELAALPPRERQARLDCARRLDAVLGSTFDGPECA
jgi:hypothetical protein